MKKLVLLIFLSVSLLTIYGQSAVYLGLRVGTYNMKDLKQFQSELEDEYADNSIPLAIVSEYPASLQVEMGVDFTREKHSLGGFLNYSTTKGRLHYGDYSGETYGDQNLHSFGIGFKPTWHVYKKFSPYVKVSATYSLLNLNFVTQLTGQDPSEETIEFYSIGGSIEPGFEWKYNLSKFYLVVNSGYLLNINGKILLSENPDAYLTLRDGRQGNLNWSGFRMGIGIGYNIGK